MNREAKPQEAQSSSALWTELCHTKKARGSMIGFIAWAECM